MDKEDRTKVFMWFLCLFATALINAVFLGVGLANGKWILAVINATGMLLCAYSAIKSHKHIWKIAYYVGRTEGYKEMEKTYFNAKAKRRGDWYGTIDI